MILYVPDTGKKTIKIGDEEVEVDERLIRDGKLRALQKLFNERANWGEKEDDDTVHDISLLKTKKLKDLKGSKRRIILNAHGRPTSFRGEDGEAMAKKLVAAGLNDKDTEEIWVIACLVGMQRQDNKEDPEAYGDLSKNKFSKQFFRTLRGSSLDLKVYVPRGWVTYTGGTWKRVGSEGRVINFTKVCVTTRDQKFKGLDAAGTKIYKEAHGPADKEEYNFWEGMLLVMFI